MKKLLLITASLLLFFNLDVTAEEAETNIDCNQTYTIDGGGNCPYNGSTHGWCSQEEFNEYANNVYSLEKCGGNGHIPLKKID